MIGKVHFSYMTHIPLKGKLSKKTFKLNKYSLGLIIIVWYIYSENELITLVYLAFKVLCRFCEKKCVLLEQTATDHK